MGLQTETLELINQYNSTDRQVIKNNLKRILIDYNIKPSDIMNLGYMKNNVYSWMNQSSTNIPLFDQALNIAVKCNFDIKEFLKD